jgi:hypothetical protein
MAAPWAARTICECPVWLIHGLKFGWMRRPDKAQTAAIAGSYREDLQRSMGDAGAEFKHEN